MSDQKCIYLQGNGERCGVIEDVHYTQGMSHTFQPPLEPTDEAVEAAAMVYTGEYVDDEDRRMARSMVKAALRVMQKGQDK